MLTQGSVTSASDPNGYDPGDAGKGVPVDGASVTSSGPKKQVCYLSVTFITPELKVLNLLMVLELNG